MHTKVCFTVSAALLLYVYSTQDGLSFEFASYVHLIILT